MMLKCEAYTQTSQATVTVRIRTSASMRHKDLQQVYGVIIQYLAAHEEQPAGPPFIVYDRRDRDASDIEAGFPVFKSLPGEDGIQAGQLPAGKGASCLFTGPYDRMEPAYQELERWISENGYESAGVAYEVYMNDPAYTPPNNLKTQIILPLKGTTNISVE
jgi:effector-binding domain-containing protein